MIEGMKKVGVVLWAIALLMYVGGFAALFSGAQFLNIHWITWFANALVLGVLVIGLKLGILIMLKSAKPTM